jgi:hypothetical protein
MAVADARPLGVGEILDAGIKVYLRNARLLMRLAATMVIPLQVITWLILISIVNKSDELANSFEASSTTLTTANRATQLGAEAVLLGVGLITSALVTAACVRAVSDLYLGAPTSFEKSLRFAARRLPAYLVMQVLTLLGLVIGFLMLIIPGIWLYGSWVVSAPALLIEGLSPPRALGRSHQLVDGRWFPTAGVALVAIVMSGLVSAAFQALIVGVGFIPGQPPVLVGVTLVTIAGAISSIIVTPFVATVWTILYYDLRIRREGYDVDLLAEQLGLPAASLPQASRSEAGSTGHQFPGTAVGPESVGRPGGPPFWPPPPDWKPGGFEPPVPGGG